MELRLGLEGTSFILGMSLEDPGMFSQIVLYPHKVESLPTEVKTNGIQNLEDATRGRESIQGRLDKPIATYEVQVQRLET